VSRLLIAAATFPLILGGLAGCARQGEIMDGGVLTAYSACPPAAIPAPAGDVTLFNPEGSRDAAAIDVVATISNLRAACVEQGDRLITSANFEVLGLRRDNRGARQVVLPYFATVVQGGQNVVAKRTGRVVLNFADGQFRATAAASTAQSQVLRSAATLPENVRRQITARRRPGDPNAALDPLSDPAVRSAVEQARYELLVGFELTQDQLRYNATR
jgi:hypothetical protein